MSKILRGIMKRFTVPTFLKYIVGDGTYCIYDVMYEINAQLYFQICDFLHQGREEHCRRSCR